MGEPTAQWGSGSIGFVAHQDHQNKQPCSKEKQWLEFSNGVVSCLEMPQNHDMVFLWFGILLIGVVHEIFLDVIRTKLGCTACMTMWMLSHPGWVAVGDFQILCS